MPRDSELHGALRIDAPGLLTRTFIVPELEAFLSRYPRLQLQIGQADRLVDLVREGIDCAIRVGEPSDSGLIMRRVGMLREVTVASPAYLARRGVSQTIADLDGHLMVGFLSPATGDVLPLEFTVDGVAMDIRLPMQVSANHSDTTADLARRGFGLIQAPRYRLAAGELVESAASVDAAPSPA
ncbi:LysR substrate-binding domain-containing protein [Sphingomonas sp. DG1-23]|uniref:LysR substrate-binding domain-containing protein n=1 Tax=Sphingomonas sp. DG1-23 TaxID=3068316 RepID=UPI00273E3691|nr:LysR substrate-binding domain-containing protein [Sphingomonas sp. DG1-23]MDP5280089.1 LysR substrate-binding domain-containing protein [Sphingomonas sp. DG1-23]